VSTYQEKLNKYVNRSNAYITKLNLKRTVLHMLDVQNLALTPEGPEYSVSVGGATSGQDTHEPARKVLEASREAGLPVMWSLWGVAQGGYDSGIQRFKAPYFCSGKPDAPGSHDTWEAQIIDSVQPQPDEIVFKKHRFSSFYGTAFNEYLTQVDCEYLIIVGSSTSNCVLTTAQDGWNRNFKVIVVADSGTAVTIVNDTDNTLPVGPVPEGYGQHWEALRNIQHNYADVMTHGELLDLMKRSAE
jgi:ureidoacrylate peracid hydrolase